MTRGRATLLLSVLAALALLAALIGNVAAATITITNLTPAPNSTIQAGVETTIAANITSDTPITNITVFLDGQRIDVEVLGPSEFQQSFFTGRILAAGTHTVRVTAANQAGETAEANWSFTDAQQLPRAGGLPIGVGLPLLSGLLALAAGIGLRLRGR
jgi:hypothetical protein